MRRNNFFKRNQYKVAAGCMAAAVLGLAGIYMLAGNEGSKEPQQKVAVEEDANKNAIKNTENRVAAKKEAEEDTEQTAKVSVVIAPKNQEEPETEILAPEIAAEEKEPEHTVETSNIVQPKKAVKKNELHFDTAAGLLWPVNGSVILDYSMDKTIYFTTLDQYKYNPAVIIAGNVNEKVKAAASGKIIEMSTNEVTGCTVTMDIGDGYTAIYGQLKEVPYEVGAYVEAGNTLGFVNEPTKYYSLEGSNLYFAMEKDGTPVDPVEFFQ